MIPIPDPTVRVAELERELTDWKVLWRQALDHLGAEQAQAHALEETLAALATFLTEAPVDALKAAEPAVLAEWSAMSAELGLRGQSRPTFPVAPTNWRILQAGWKAIAAHMLANRPEPPLPSTMPLQEVSARLGVAEEKVKRLEDENASLKAEVAALHRDNERLRWRHETVVPEWNDLTNEQRAVLCRIGSVYSDEPFGGQLAAEFYESLRKSLNEAPKPRVLRQAA